MDPAPEVEAVNCNRNSRSTPRSGVCSTGIVQRDILRPYIKRIVVPNPGSPSERSREQVPEQRRAGGFQDCLAVGVACSRKYVWDTINQRTMRFKTGDARGRDDRDGRLPNDAEGRQSNYCRRSAE